MPYDWHYNLAYADGTTADFTVTTASVLNGSGYDVLSVSGTYRGFQIVGPQDYFVKPNQLGLGSDYYDGIGSKSPLSIDLGNSTGAVFYNQGGRIFSQDGTNLPPQNYPVVNSYSTTACFVAGTMIATAGGEAPVESLDVGDLVRVQDGTLRPVVWRGHVRALPSRHPRRHEVDPVRIRAGAIFEDVPSRDLLVSPGHALLIDDILVNAGDLVNGGPIVQEQWDVVDYHHLELGDHDLLIANGMPCESYLDDGNRDSFEGSAYARMHARLDRATEPRCRPLVKSGPGLQEVRRNLLARARETGWRLTERPNVHLAVGDRVFPPIAVSADRLWFVVPSGSAGPVALRSEAMIVDRVDPVSVDRRRLGVAIHGLRVDGEEVPLASPILGRGFYPLEHENGVEWRWTDGDAILLIDRPIAVVEISVHMVLPTLSHGGESEPAGSATLSLALSSL